MRDFVKSHAEIRVRYIIGIPQISFSNTTNVFK